MSPATAGLGCGCCRDSDGRPLLRTGAPGIVRNWCDVRGNDITDPTSFVQDNPLRHASHLAAIMDGVISTALSLANTTRGNHQLWPVGSDFQ